MFKILKQSKINRARLGEFPTNHGVVKTPVFMPPGTQATVKAVGPDDLEKIGVEILLINTFHLYLRPGEKTINQLGGIHKFMSWKKPILSDSGGFQAWSLAGKEKQSLSKISEDGVEFISPIDGSKHFFTPEKSIEIQHKLGADIIMAFDECAPDNNDKEYIKKAMERTHSWEERSLKKHKELIKNNKNSSLIFGIVQGGNFLDLRKRSLEFIKSLPFDGIAFGGETIGYNIPKTLEILDYLKNELPEEKPLYALGLGASLKDIIEAVKRGVDMFDCVNPTRIARHGEFYNGKITNIGNEISFESEFTNGRLKISNSRFKDDKKPISENCDCYSCQNFSRAYLRHLYLAKEPLYLRLATIHNLRFIMRLIHTIRNNI